MNFRRTYRIALPLCTILLALVAGCTPTSQKVTHPFVGITCIDRTETVPRPLRMHIVDIDLAAPGLRFHLTPHAGPLETHKQTTLDFLTEQKAQLAINVHYFEPWPAPAPDNGGADLVGIAASDGRVYSPFDANPPKQYAIHPDAPGINIDSHNHASVVHRNAADATGYTAVESVTLYNTVSGNEQIVCGGRISAADTEWNNKPGPHTDMGLTRNHHLVLFIVDGRQKGVSEGMKTAEVAALLIRDYGVVDAVNLDGGGSTTLAVSDPKPHVVNVPVGIKDVPGTLRPVGSNLAVFARPRK